MTPWTAACQASLSLTISRNLPKFMFIELVMPSNHLILCCSLLLLPSIFPSIRVFSSELAFHIRWLKFWSFSFSISPSNEYSGLISLRIDWYDLFAVHGTQESSPAPQFESISFLVFNLHFLCIYISYIYDPVLMVFYLSHSKIYELKRTTLFFFSDLVGLHETFLFTNKNEKKIFLTFFVSNLFTSSSSFSHKFDACVFI